MGYKTFFREDIRVKMWGKYQVARDRITELIHWDLDQDPYRVKDLKDGFGE